MRPHSTSDMRRERRGRHRASHAIRGGVNGLRSRAQKRRRHGRVIGRCQARSAGSPGSDAVGHRGRRSAVDSHRLGGGLGVHARGRRRPNTARVRGRERSLRTALRKRGSEQVAHEIRRHGGDRGAPLVRGPGLLDRSQRGEVVGGHAAKEVLPDSINRSMAWVGTRYLRPILISGVGHVPSRTMRYPRLRPQPISLNAVSRLTVRGRGSVL
jgi:hypothetical protein